MTDKAETELKAAEYEPRFVRDAVPADCCHYAIVSLSKGKEICRVWEEEDAREIAELMNTRPTQTADAVEAACRVFGAHLSVAGWGDATLGEIDDDAIEAAMKAALSTSDDSGDWDAMEPDAWMYEHPDGARFLVKPEDRDSFPRANCTETPLYAHPPTPQDSGLADELEAAIAECEKSAASQFGASGSALKAVYTAARKLAALRQPRNDGELLREVFGYAENRRIIAIELEKAVAAYQKQSARCWHGDELIANADLSHAVNNLTVAINHAFKAGKSHPWEVGARERSPRPSRSRGRVMQELTYWNGERCQAEKVRVIVGTPRRATWWFAGLEGTERRAVRITADGQTFYIDNDDGPDWAAGDGWDKVTIGKGSPQWGHASLDVSRDLGTEHEIEMAEFRKKYASRDPIRREDYPSRQAYRHALAKQFGNNRP